MTVFTRAAAIAALLLAAACGGEPEVLEPDSTTATSRASAMPPPPLPAAAKEDSESGAATFVLFWVNTSHYASISGDWESLARISSADCISCSNLLSVYKDAAARGGAFTGGEQTLADVTAERSPDGNVVLVRAESTIASGTFKESRTATPRPVAEEITRVTYRVERDGEEWKMAEFAVDE